MIFPLLHLGNAIQFLTRIPIPACQTFNPRKMLPFFPIAGLLIGGMVGVLDVIAHFLWSRPVASLLDILFLTWLTGALHIDGLGDTADGLYGNRPKEKILLIMKDSRLGSMGVTAIILVLLLKAVTLSQISEGRLAVFFLVISYSRASVLLAVRNLPYLRGEEGTGHAFFSPPLRFQDFWGFFLIIPLSFLPGYFFFISFNLVFILFNTQLLRFYRKKLGGVTGDMIGAMIEVNEAVLLITFSIKVNI